MTKKKTATLVIITILAVVLVITGIILKIKYDNKMEQDRLIAVQAQVELEEKEEAEKAEKLAKEQAEIAEKAEKEAAEKLAKEQAEKAEKDAAAAKEKEEAAIKEALAKKKAAEDAEKAKKEQDKGNGSSGGNTGGSITTPGGGSGSSGGWQSYPGNLSAQDKKDTWDYIGKWVGGPEPTGEYRDRLTKLTEGGLLVKVEWNSKIGMWERLDEFGEWKLVSPADGGTRSYEGFGQAKRY